MKVVLETLDTETPCWWPTQSCSLGEWMRNQTRAFMRMMSGGRVGKVEGGRELIYTVNGRG